jgi:hypothetical protein
VAADDYSQFAWDLLLQEKSDAFDAAQQLFKKIQIEHVSFLIGYILDKTKTLYVMVTF